MVSISPLYKYTPLYADDAIRVLNLQPASTYSDEVYVRLEIIRFPSAVGEYEQYLTPYEAVSYTWGEANFSHHLHCEGQIIAVTANVDLLLRRLRKPSGPRILWVDSVCINQQDKNEKTIQIGMMDQIYSRANKVHVWLGEAAPSDRIKWVFEFFREIARSDRDENKIFSWKIDGTKPWDKDPQKSVDRFLSRPWFGRRWILQEVILGLDITVRCGQFKMPWQCLIRAGAMLHSHSHGRDSLSATSLRSLATLAYMSKPSNQLLKLLFEFDRSECFLPGDRIFALYGMVAKLKTTPDAYRKPWRDIYVDVGGICLKEHHFMTLMQHLTAFGPLSDEIPDAPSWIPNWKNARFSESRFCFRDPDHPPQNCELIQKEPSKIYSQDGLYRVFRDFQKQAKQDVKQQKVTIGDSALVPLTRATNFRESLAMLFLHCRQYRNIEQDMLFDTLAPKNMVKCNLLSFLAQILSSAIMDMRLHFNTQDVMVKSEQAFFGKLIQPAFRTPDLAAGHADYSNCFSSLKQRIKGVLETADHNSRKHLQSEILQNFQDGENMQFCEFLNHHNLFYIRIETQKGPVYVPGITLCSIENGDWVLRPQCKADEITPRTTAFLMRPMCNEAIYYRSTTPHFRIVGLCFVAEYKSENELEESTFKCPTGFVIV